MNLKYCINFILAISLLSCTGNSDKEDELLYWASNNQDEILFAQMVTENWNKSNPELALSFQPVPEGQSSEEVILAAVVGNTTPDIYSNMWQGDVEFYARSGKLVPLDTISGFMDFLYERCDSSVVEEIRSTDGHIYQIPWKINPIMLIYNEKMFRSVGFTDPPVTYNDFRRAAEKLKKDDVWIGYSEVLVTWWQRLFDFYPLYLAASNGGMLVKGDTVLFNNKHTIETFRFLKSLYDNGYFPRERISARQDPFLSGNIATRFTGPWEIAHAEKFKPEGFEYSYTRLPVPDGHMGKFYTYGDTKNIVIFNTCRDVNRAWKFLRFMLSRENDFAFLKLTAQLPRRKDLLSDPLFKDFFNNNPRMLPFAVQSTYVRGPDNSPVLKEVFDIISQEYEACVIYGKKSPEQAVNDAAFAAGLLLRK